MDKTILRPASEEDFPANRALIRIVGINPTGLDWHRFVVAVTPDDEMIGCGQVKPRADGTRELASIAVRPAYRQQGIAQAIMVADCATIMVADCATIIARLRRAVNCLSFYLLRRRM